MSCGHGRGVKAPGKNVAPERGVQVAPIRFRPEGKRAEHHLALGQRPDWIKVDLKADPTFFKLKKLARTLNLTTVCEEARCPNVYECWAHGTATFMINGERCTRTCGFCAVESLHPNPLDPEEPGHVGDAVQELGLRHAVVTAVNRDDIADGGAAQFVETIASIRTKEPGCAVEVLIPDFEGNPAAIDAVLEARPEVLNHNIETVPRLYRSVRPQARYATSLALLARAAAFRDQIRADHRAAMVTKSGMMVGLGESPAEVSGVMRDLLAVGVEVLTIGQYLSPSLKHLPVARWVTPQEFDAMKEEGLALGFRHVESGPFVRSSYHAHEHVPG
jgi:lipoic acid synthetase